MSKAQPHARVRVQRHALQRASAYNVSAWPYVLGIFGALFGLLFAIYAVTREQRDVTNTEIREQPDVTSTVVREQRDVTGAALPEQRDVPGAATHGIEAEPHAPPPRSSSQQSPSDATTPNPSAEPSERLIWVQ
jgi:hypothetical protein